MTRERWGAGLLRVGGAAPPAASRCSARASLRTPSRGDPPLKLQTHLLLGERFPPLRRESATLGLMRIRGLVTGVLLLTMALPLVALAQEAPAGYPGQSNLVPAGMPTPTTPFERLPPGGPSPDSGRPAWGQPGPYPMPGWTNFALRSFSSPDYI